MFSPVTHFKPHNLLALLLNVIILSLSEGVSVSSKNLMVDFTSSIFSPCIDPLLSMTQIRSTLVLLPPLDLRVAMTGKSVLVLSLMSDLWALSWSYSLTSLDSSFAFYINFSSSLYTEDYYAG
jgi:hypothetical protein